MSTARRTRGIPAWALVGLFMIQAVPSPAAAASDDVIVKQNDEHRTLDVGVLFHAIWFGGVGTGLRVGIPVAPRGFIPKINDQVKIEIGGSFQHWWSWRVHPRCDGHAVDHFFRLGLPVLLRWDFFITKLVTVETGLGVEIGVPFHPDPDVADCLRRRPDYVYGWATLAIQFGILLNFHERVSMRMQFSHSGFDIGVEFRLGKV